VCKPADVDIEWANEAWKAGLHTQQPCWKDDIKTTYVNRSVSGRLMGDQLPSMNDELLTVSPAGNFGFASNGI